MTFKGKANIGLAMTRVFVCKYYINTIYACILYDCMYLYCICYEILKQRSIMGRFNNAQYQCITFDYLTPLILLTLTDIKLY